MQSYHSTEHHSTDFADRLIHTASVVPSGDYADVDAAQTVVEPVRFYSQFTDCMEMQADVATVSRYFDVHHEWFRRCAHPMKADAIGENSYALAIGRYGSFGYEIEPKIGLNLLPGAAGIYRIETVPVPDYVTPGYEVDFRAAMELVEVPFSEVRSLAAGGATALNSVTRVQWQLDLTVHIQFPRFIHALPKSLIQTTGDRLLQQVVRQVSGRLTHKVLEDFHKTHHLPVPKAAKRWFFHKQDD